MRALQHHLGCIASAGCSGPAVQLFSQSVRHGRRVRGGPQGLQLPVRRSPHSFLLFAAFCKACTPPPTARQPSVEMQSVCTPVSSAGLLKQVLSADSPSSSEALTLEVRTRGVAWRGACAAGEEPAGQRARKRAAQTCPAYAPPPGQIPVALARWQVQGVDGGRRAGRGCAPGQPAVGAGSKLPGARQRGEGAQGRGPARHCCPSCHCCAARHSPARTAPPPRPPRSPTHPRAHARTAPNALLQVKAFTTQRRGEGATSSPFLMITDLELLSGGQTGDALASINLNTPATHVYKTKGASASKAAPPTHPEPSPSEE